MLKLRNLKAPEKKIIVPNKDKKFLSRLLLLHNNLMQYHNIPYEEVLIKFEHTLSPGDVIPTSEMLIYFEPKRDFSFARIMPMQAFNIYKIVDHYITTGLITKEEMEMANAVWREIKEKAHGANKQ